MIFPSRLLALGLGLAAASGLAVWSSSQKPGPVASKRPDMPVRSASPRRLAEGPLKPLPLNPSRRHTDKAAPAGVADVTPGVVLTSEVMPESAALIAFQPTREELEFRALMVEQHANKQLKNLLGVLKLSEAQQDRIFSTLARHSDYYHPALQFQNATGAEISPGTSGSVSQPDKPSATTPVSTSPAAADPAADPAVDPLVAELEPDQVEVYERYRSERDAFWAGVVSDIEQKLSTNGE